jgi:hypothetical protein
MPIRPVLLALVATLCVKADAAAQAPDRLSAPGDRPLMTLGATGVQIYECRRGNDGSQTWAFREPRANLTQGGTVVGRHYAGPSWELNDGSKVVARAVASADGPLLTAIPLLRLEVTERSGSGALSEVTHIQRLNTNGGVLRGPCPTAGQVTEVVYTADYVMLRSR